MIFNKPFTFDRVFRIGITVLVLYAIFLFLDYIQDVLVPFAIAALLAYWLQPLVRFLQTKARIKSRILAVILALVLVLAVLTGIFMLLIPLIVSEVRAMGQMLANLSAVQDLEARIQEYLPENLSQYVADLAQRPEVRDFFNSEKAGDLALNAVRNIVPGLWDIFSGALNVILGLVGLAIVLLYLIFILQDYDKVMLGWKSLLPPQYKDTIINGVGDFKEAMSNYFRAQALIAASVGVLFAIGFSIIGLPLGILFGLFVGMLNLVPYLQNIGFVPATFLALAHSLETQTSFLTMIALVLVVFAVVQTIQDAILTPKIMGNATGLNPAVMLLSLSVWGKLLGILGLMIALPITFLLYSYYKRFVLHIKESVALAEDNPTPQKKQLTDN